MLLGVLLIGLASVSWGTTGATMTLLARHTAIGPLLVGWVRLAVAAPWLLLATAASALLAGRGARARFTRRDIRACIVLGLAMAAYQVCYFWAVTLSGVTVAALLAICSAPLLIAVLAAALLQEHLGAPVRFALVLAVAGTALLVVGPRGLGDISGRFGLGALLALGAGVSYAVYAVAAKGVLSRLPPLPVAAATFTLAALFLFPFVAMERSAPALVLAGWPWLLYLGTGPTAAAYVLFTTGLKRVPATVAGIVSLLEPLTASLLGVFGFGESLGALGVAGAFLLIASLGLLVLTRPDAATEPALRRSGGA